MFGVPRVELIYLVVLSLEAVGAFRSTTSTFPNAARGRGAEYFARLTATKLPMVDDVLWKSDVEDCPTPVLAFFTAPCKFEPYRLFLS